MNCPFCNIKDKTEPKFPLNINLFNGQILMEQILMETPNFIVKLDIAPIIKYHFLIIPKKHYKSCLSYPKELISEHQLIKSKIINFYKQMSKSYIFFEHGMAIDYCDNSCIEHSHLHSIPIDPKTIDSFNIFIRKKLSNTKKTNKIIIDDDYISIETEKYKHFWKSKTLESQILRKLIVDFMDIPYREKWQYCLTNPEELIITLQNLDTLDKINFL